MNTDPSTLHPQLAPFAKMFPRFSYSQAEPALLPVDDAPDPPSRVPPGIRVENVFLPRPDGGRRLRLRIYEPHPAPSPTPVLLWLHGGGYMLGRPEMDDRLCLTFVRELGISVVSVDYRCAPRHPFPAALEDGYAALRWVSAPPHAHNFDAHRIAVGGQSAGGGLAASLAQFAHDQGQIRPVFQLLVYPMLDDRTVLRDDLNDRAYIAWDPKSNRLGWESHLGGACGAADVPPYAVPARRAHLSGLPPAWIGVGTLDLFHDESLAYARRLQEHGVACQTHVVLGAFHGFDVFDSRIPVVQDFRRSQISALRQYLK